MPSSPPRSLYILHILDDGYYASLFLLLPFLTEELHISLTQVGFLGTLLNSLGILLALPAGYLATRIGGMRLLLLCVLFYGLGFIGTGLAASYPWLFPAFIVAGIGFALFHPIATALVARYSSPDTRGRNMGNFTAIGDIGKMGISSLLTFVVVGIGWRSTSLLFGMIGIGCGLVFLLLMRWKKEKNPHAPSPPKTMLPLWHVLHHPRFVYALCASFLDTFSSASFFVFLPFLLRERGIDVALLGTISAVFFLGNLCGKTILGRIADRFSSAVVLIFSEILMTLCIALLAQSHFIPLIITCCIVAGIFTRGTVPVIQTMIAQASDHHGHFEKAFAVSAFMDAIALTLSPVFLGFVSDHWGIRFAFYAMAVVASLAALPAALFRWSRGR